MARIELDFGFVVVRPLDGPLEAHLAGHRDPRTERAAFIELAFIAEIIEALAAPPVTNGLPESNSTNGEVSTAGDDRNQPGHKSQARPGGRRGGEGVTDDDSIQSPG